MLGDFPHADVRVAFVWIDMVAGDSQATADNIAATIADERAEHWYDVDHIAGQAIAESLGGAGMVAWDTYLLYPPATIWTDLAPQPHDWAHQLDATSFADPAYYQSGVALNAKLQKWMDKLVV